MVENKDDKGAGGEVGLPAGARIGKYEIVERIGIGGQSIVYKGYDSLLNRHVAMKQVSSHLAGDKRFIERFRREAQILARLGGEDSGIVAVYDLLENQSGLFVVMEYVPGHSLHKVLEHQRYAMPVGVAMEIIWRIANGLRVAHAEGIVHRDIKPGNVLITRDYGAKITDFGVAATVGGEDSIALGTTKYMAPELFSGSTIDARVDIY
ncbi:MAG: serine/threonine protein kinase, partial [Planctomycetes bacterium]|nr:serine/threonine protein kinase [Planctomycetota bacterium]